MKVPKILIFLLLLKSFNLKENLLCQDYINKASEVVIIEPWRQSNVKLTYVSVDHGGRQIAIDQKNLIWTRVGGLFDPWNLLSGQLRQISIRNGRVVGCNSNDELYYKASINSEWQRLQGAGKLIVIDEFGAMIHCNANYEVYYKQSIDSAWERQSIKLKQVDMSMGRAIGVTQNGEIFYSENIAQQQWIGIQGQMKFVSITERGIICALDNSGNVYFKSNPSNSQFVKVQQYGMDEILVSQIDCKGNLAWATNQYQQLLRLEFQ